MNCKPGDLAILVGGAYPEFIGEVYRVLRPYDGKRFAADGPAWYVEHRGEEWHCTDRHIRPIRPQPDDAQDESFKWAPAPEKVLIHSPDRSPEKQGEPG
jgi:hypothetical protein